MRRSQKHERQSHEKRRNEDHDKILQNTAPVCGKAGIDLLDVGKKVRNPSAQTGERGSAENQLVCDHSGNGSVKRSGSPLQPARAHSRGLPFSLHITVKLSLDPCHQQFHDALLLILRQLPSHRDVIPLMQASTAAAGAGVLGDKHRMPAHRRLLAVIGDACRCKPRSDEVGSVALNGLHTLVRYVLPVLLTQMELCAEGGSLQTGKRLLNCRHDPSPHVPTAQRPAFPAVPR